MYKFLNGSPYIISLLGFWKTHVPLESRGKKLVSKWNCPKSLGQDWNIVKPWAARKTTSKGEPVEEGKTSRITSHSGAGAGVSEATEKKGGPNSKKKKKKKKNTCKLLRP